MALEDRFWEKVEKGCEPPEHVRGEVDGDCWEWTAKRDRDGYGRISVNGSQKRSHRISLFLEGRNVRDDLVLHHCDNPPCVNPDHLYLGDQQDNTRDCRDRKGTLASQKLSKDDVVEIRERYAGGGITQSDLAREYRLRSRGTIGMVVRGETWPDAPGPIKREDY